MQVALVPFQLSVGARGSSGYTLRATAAGREAEAPLELPALPPEREVLGAALGRALFPPPIRRLLIDVARGADAAGARVQIQLQLGAPELEALPWEWASLGQDAPWRPALREDYTLMRVGVAPRPQPPLRFHGPLRLLIACAPGATAAAAPLGHALGEAVRCGSLVVDLLRDADLAALRDALDEEPCHALHLVADDAGGTGAAARLRLGRNLDPAALAAVLADFPALRLLTLAAPDAAPSALNGVAAAVHQRLGMAAIGLGELTHEAAARFCGPCYSALAAGDPADLAVTDGRAALAAAGMAWGASRAWIVPGGEQLFDPRPGQPAGEGRAGRAEQGSRAASLPVGTPLRPRHEPTPPGRTARAISAARAFVVATTTVGQPAQRQRAEGPRDTTRRIKLIVLAVACVVLALMVSRVLPTAEPAADEAGISSTAPALQSTAGAVVAQPDQTAALSLAEPPAYSAYLAVAGDTLASIAERAGSEADALARLNGLPPGAPLRPGQPLVVPIYHDGEALPPAPIVNRGNPASPLVALTFDIEIDDASLYGILEVLASRGVKGTFFVTGDWVQSYPAAAQAIVAAGHEVANQSLTHTPFSSLGSDSAANELAETERIVREVMGVSTRPYFRFPFGDSNPAMVELVGNAGYVAYHWSADDFAIPSWLAQAAANPAEANGGILLMHGRSATVDSLGDYIDQLRALGLTPTTLGAALR